MAGKPLNRRLAISLAVLVMWLAGSIGIFLLHLQRWHFFFLGGYDIPTLGQIGAYYLARVGAQLPACGLVAIIIGVSDFDRPVRVACFTALIYHAIMSSIRLARDPWAAVPNLDQSIPLLAEVAQTILLVAGAAFFTWLFISLAARLEAGALARYSHKLN